MRDLVVERDLVARMRSGDGSAVSDLAATYGPKIHQLAFRHMRNTEDAEEVTQDVLLKVYQKIDAFRGDAALSSWIYRITFNTAMSRLRNGRFSRPAEVAQSVPLTLESDERRSAGRQVVDWSSQADDEVLRAEMRQRLLEAIRTLPAIYRVPVILRDIKGLSTEEASAILRVKTQTLKSRLHRGRLILRERLSEFAGGLSLHRAA